MLASEGGECTKCTAEQNLDVLSELVDGLKRTWC